VDRDGDVDLIFAFRAGQTGIACRDTEATLMGQTFAGESFAGTDGVVAIGC